jgi:proteasome lid subunit RPN8/RPN11
MTKRKFKSEAAQPAVVIDSDVVRRIRQHARSCSKTEVCGVLVGRENGKSSLVEACIAGINAAQAGTHVTFTQDTWQHIYQIKDRDYPDHRIVGWYHSHPGFGVFLSDHDTFIHRNFFSSALQVAWVYDPHSDEEGCFGWVGDRIERISEIAVADRKGGEGAGETGKPEPVGFAEGNDGDEEEGRSDDASSESPPWLRWMVTVASYLSVFVVGFFIAYFFFPLRVPVPVPVDPQTGRPILRYLPGEPSSQAEPHDNLGDPSARRSDNNAGRQSSGPNSGNRQGKDAQRQ